MISVIIPKYEDDLYLIRCLNSIRRQTYKDVEILIVDGDCDQETIDKYNLILVENDGEGVCDGLNKAIAQSKGQYVYFCNVSTVLAPNALESLIAEATDVCSYVNTYLVNGNSFKENDTQLYCSGKLFEKAKLEEYGIDFDDSIFSEKFFVMRYIGCFDEIRKLENVYIYETEKSVVCKSIDTVVNEKRWQDIFTVIKESCKELRDLFRNTIIQFIKANKICDEILARIVEKEFHDDYELCYMCIAPVLKSSWNEMVNNKSEEALDVLRTYLKAYEDEKLFNLLLQVCGLKTEHYEFIKDNTPEQCVFLIAETDRLSGIDSKLATEFREVWNNPSAGLRNVESIWYYYSNGQIDRTYRGLAKNKYGWFYVSNGVIDRKYKGLCQNEYGIWYVSNGTIDRKYTGLAMNDTGIWMYVNKGKVDTDYVGIVETKGGVKYISNGTIDREYTGLYKTKNGKWVYIENGTINTNYIGLARNEYGWWYVDNGTIDFSYNGCVKNNLGWCEVKNGKLVSQIGSDMLKMIEELENAMNDDMLM